MAKVTKGVVDKRQGNTRGGRTTLIIVPKEETAYWEKRIFIAILFFFVPLYALIFIQMSEVMLEK